MELIKKLICKVLDHDFLITLSTRDKNGTTIVKEVKCRRCGKIVRYEK